MEGPFWTNFLNDPLDELKNIPSSRKFYLFQEDGQKRKMVIKIEFTPLSLSDYKIAPFKKGFKKLIGA